MTNDLTTDALPVAWQLDGGCPPSAFRLRAAALQCGVLCMTGKTGDLPAKTPILSQKRSFFDEIGRVSVHPDTPILRNPETGPRALPETNNIITKCP